jgi:oligopeptide/dipeptide ABC transporter ATP-binding protein
MLPAYVKNNTNDVEQPLVSIQSLSKYFPVRKGFFRKKEWLRAVDNVGIDIYKGETLGLVGESGCGKTTLGRLILRLIDPAEGNILYKGTDLAGLSNRAMKAYRKEIQIVFQDPFASLNPRLTVGNTIARNLKIHNIFHGAELKDQIGKLLSSVGIPPEFAARYPHEFSGGQRQRIAIARALATDPNLIIADEPTSALDVSVQAKILNLLRRLQRERDLTILFISHNISVIKHISDRVAVMYLGKIVESGPKAKFFDKPLHPYAKALLSAVPNPNPEIRLKAELLEGEVPSSVDPPSGCRFHPRCPSKMLKCSEVEPEIKVVGESKVACFLY